MIIPALIIVTVLFFIACNLFLKNKLSHSISTVIASLLLFGTIVFSIMNFHNHYGMHLVNHTHVEKIASVSPKQKLLIYENLGSAKKHNLVIYKHSQHGKALHTKPDVNVTNHFVKTSSSQPRLKVVHKNWNYRSGAARFWFALPQRSQTRSTANVFYVPKKWTVLSAQQAKVMKQSAKAQAKLAKKQMASPQAKAKVKQQAQAFVQAKMAKVTQKDPKMTPSQKKVLMKKFAKEFQTQMKQKAMQKLMQKALAKAKASPVGYATK